MTKVSLYCTQKQREYDYGKIEGSDRSSNKKLENLLVSAANPVQHGRAARTCWCDTIGTSECPRCQYSSTNGSITWSESPTWLVAAAVAVDSEEVTGGHQMRMEEGRDHWRILVLIDDLNEDQEWFRVSLSRRYCAWRRNDIVDIPVPDLQEIGC